MVSLPGPVAGDVTFPLVIGGLVLSSRCLEPFIGLRDQLHCILSHALNKVLVVSYNLIETSTMVQCIIHGLLSF